MKKKCLTILLCAGLTVSTLAGCSSDASADKAAQTTDKAATEAAADTQAADTGNTDSDMQYVKDKGTLVVGITDFEPMDYKDDNGKCYPQLRNWIRFEDILWQYLQKYEEISRRSFLKY